MVNFEMVESLQARHESVTIKKLFLLECSMHSRASNMAHASAVKMELSLNIPSPDLSLPLPSYWSALPYLAPCCPVLSHGPI